MKLKILVGTVTGTAMSVAQAIELDCSEFVSSIEVRLMDGLDLSVFEEDALFLICISTYGSGDVPDNARALFDSLDQTPRYLGALHYGVIALGDLASHAATYCLAGKQFDERLQGLGAQRVGDIRCLDASDGSVPEAEAAAWCRDWLALTPAAPCSGKP